MNWLKQLFCKHQWVMVFRGTATRGDQCTKCKKGRLVTDWYDGQNTGWVNER